MTDNQQRAVHIVRAPGMWIEVGAEQDNLIACIAAALDAKDAKWTARMEKLAARLHIDGSYLSGTDAANAVIAAIEQQQ